MCKCVEIGIRRGLKILGRVACGFKTPPILSSFSSAFTLLTITKFIEDVGCIDMSTDKTSTPRRCSTGTQTTPPMSKSSLHAWLTNYLREKIYSHELVSGQRIASENELAKQYSLSRGTVRKAISTLIEEGLLKTIQGSGTFVADHALSHPAGVRPLSFAESLHQQGKSFQTYILAKEVLPASNEVARHLHIQSGESVMFMRRVRSVNGQPIMCQESWCPLRECPGIDEVDFTQAAAFDAVEKCSGRRIKTAQMRYVARVAGRQYCEYLAVDENAPVLLLIQTIFLEDGVPIEWSFTWLKAGQEIIGTATQE